jgi:hypothetical protein
MSLKPETITLEGWNDEDGEVMTSCVLVQTSARNMNNKLLSGSRGVAYDVLIKIGGCVHIDTWRDAVYSAGISPSSSQDAKRKAFKRAVSELRDMNYIATKDDLWWATYGTPDK